MLTLGEGRQGREQPLTLGKDVHAFPQIGDAVLLGVGDKRLLVASSRCDILAAGLRRSATFVRMKTKPLIWSAGCLSVSRNSQIREQASTRCNCQPPWTRSRRRRPTASSEALRAEAETAIAKLQSDASACVELTRRDAEARIARMEADAESCVLQLQDELAQAKQLTDQARAEARIAHDRIARAQSASVARGLKLKIGSCGSRPTWG